jgi:anti-sigma factor RsiW
MDDHPLSSVSQQGRIPPITEADLHAFVDGQLAPARRAEIDCFLANNPEDMKRVQDWEDQNARLHRLLDPVLGEPLPLELPLRPQATVWHWRGLAAGIAVAIVSAGGAWMTRGAMDADTVRLALATSEPSTSTGPVRTADRSDLSGFARRAAIAHVVYSPDLRRPVEVGADQEQALVAWLTKRMGSSVRAPSLGTVGFELIGGRLLPGDDGPVAQFMYGDAAGQRLTLYVTREVDDKDTSFRFGKDGPVNVFYWVEHHFGYAISAGADRETLLKVSQEVYRQLNAG